MLRSKAPRRLGDALRVGEMTSVVIGHLERLRERRRCHDPQLGQKDGYVLCRMRKRRCGLVVRLAFEEQGVLVDT